MKSEQILETLIKSHVINLVIGVCEIKLYLISDCW